MAGGTINQKKTISGSITPVKPNTGSVSSGGGGTHDHNRLYNRGLEDQHPISAITGLETALNNKQDKIDAAHKLSSDLVDDTNHANKFVTETDKVILENAIENHGIGYTISGVDSKINSKYINYDTITTSKATFEENVVYGKANVGDAASVNVNVAETTKEEGKKFAYDIEFNDDEGELVLTPLMLSTDNISQAVNAPDSQTLPKYLFEDTDVSKII